MGSAVSVRSLSVDKETLPTENLLALHNLNLSFAHRSFQSLSALTDDDIERLVKAIQADGRRSDKSLIEEMDAVHCYLGRLKQRLLDTSSTVPQKPINEGPDGKMYPFCISLEFLHNFLKEYPEAENMTTAEVVYKIIIPETKESKLTYVEAKLVSKHPQYFRVMGPMFDSS